MSETKRNVHVCVKHRAACDPRTWLGCAACLAGEVELLNRALSSRDKQDADFDQALAERDRAQDALQEAHIALGGDGEWVAKIPPEAAPDSGDLHLDVPELARRQRQRAEFAHAALRGLLTACEEAKWPLTAEQMLPMNEARKALAAEGEL